MSASERPHIVLICADQWRADCFGVEGHPVVETPFLDQLSTRGCRFTRAYCGTPTCIPARASMFTGLSQRSHGRIGYCDGVPWEYPVTLAGEFKKHGYQTQAVGKMHVYPARARLGFDDVVLHDGYLHHNRKGRDLASEDDYIAWLRKEEGPAADYFDHGINCNSFISRPWDKPEKTHPSNYLVTEAIDFFRRRDPTCPFFLYLSFHRPHPPFDPPQWAFDLYKDREMPEPPRGDWFDAYADLQDPLRPDLFAGRMSPDRLRLARAGYYALMTQIDHQINRLIESMEEYGLAENTYFCFVSDHGEMIGDHDLFRKAYPYEGSSHIPLFLSGPKDSGIVPRSTNGQLVELRDLLPTLLDCAGLPVPASVEGMSALPFARGQEAPAGWREYLHGEHTFQGQSLQWITNGHEKYVWLSRTGREQFFDLDRDPLELHDLGQDPATAPRVKVWRECLIKELTGREEGYTDGVRLIPGRPPRLVLEEVLVRRPPASPICNRRQRPPADHPQNG